MLMAVKNQINVSLLSIKYALMREMLNKTTFISNIVFMILNNACFIVQWVVLFSIKDNIAGATLKEVLLLWALASSTFGVSRFFFKNAFELPEIITSGKLDVFLVQPKNVLLSAITTDVQTSAIGDMLYGIILLFVYGFTFERLLLFILFSICGGLIITSISIIFSSLSFWFPNSSMLADTIVSITTTVATYPGEIFKGFTKILLYTLIPVGLSNYIPHHLLINFDLLMFVELMIFTILIVIFAFQTFNRGLKRYSSTNLMNVRI